MWELNAPLDVDYITKEGFYLYGACAVDEPEKNVSFSLLYKPVSGLSGPIARIDWLPFHDHGNKGRITGPWSWATVKGTHIHSYDLNSRYGWDRMVKENLPIALPVDAELRDFNGLLEYVGQTWNISGIRAIPTPEWYMI